MKKYSVFVTLVCIGLIFYIFSAKKTVDVDQRSLPSSNVISSPTKNLSGPLYVAAVETKSIFSNTATQKPISKTTYNSTKKPVLSLSSNNTSKNTTKQESNTKTYILNTNTKKFHIPSCSSVKQMNESNKQKYNGSRQDLINKGYSPCKRCHP